MSNDQAQCRLFGLRHSFVICLSTFVILALAPWLPTGAQESIEDLEEQAIRDAVAAVSPSVVQIETVGGLERVGKLLVGTGPTTGLVVSADGYIISSAFNFVQKPTSILVTLPSGKRAAAQIVARDHSRMLVLLKVNSTEKLSVPIAVPRDQVQVGQWAIAVGRTFKKDATNFSVGIVSARARILGKAIQTDAKVSPVNYGGPLVDISGRVLGVLVPLSPQGAESEIAGAEWYDSGIGFAVPLADIFARLDTLKSGNDLHPGILGVSLKRGDVYSLPAEIMACRSDGPAGRAGLKAGDVIVEIDGSPIERQAQLRDVLGTYYAGEKVKVAVRRGSGRIEAEVPLVEKLAPYQHPFLGILPLRSAGPGVGVRFVYPESPAAKAGIQVADKITAVNGAPVVGRTELIDQVALLEAGKIVTLAVERGAEKLSLELTPGKLPTDVPGDLPEAQPKPDKEPEQKPTTGVVEIKLPEEKNACAAYVPENYHPEVPHGVIVWLHPPGAWNKDQLASRWQAACEKHHFLVLAPQAADPARWDPTDAAVVRKLIDDLASHYNVDRTRIAVYGYQSAGSMAFLTGLNHLDRVRAIVAVDAAPPARTVVPDNDPLVRLSLYLPTSEKSPAAAAVKVAADRFREALYPVTTKSLGDQPRDLNEAEIAELVRWLDSLDRI